MTKSTKYQIRHIISIIGYVGTALAVLLQGGCMTHDDFRTCATYTSDEPTFAQPETYQFPLNEDGAELAADTRVLIYSRSDTSVWMTGFVYTNTDNVLTVIVTEVDGSKTLASDWAIQSLDCAGVQ